MLANEITLNYMHYENGRLKPPPELALRSTVSVEHYRWGDGCNGWHLVKTPDLSII